MSRTLVNVKRLNPNRPKNPKVNRTQKAAQVKCPPEFHEAHVRVEKQVWRGVRKQAFDMGISANTYVNSVLKQSLGCDGVAA